MPTLTTAMTTALGATISQPGIFMQLGFTTPLYYTDRNTKTWNSQSWTSADFVVGNYTLDMTVLQSITLSFTDFDYSLSALLLSQTAADKNVKLWYYDNTALAVLDPVLIFDGLMDNPSGGDNRRLNVPCATVNKNLPVGMLSHLIPSYLFAPENTEVAWGPVGSSVIFSRRQAYL